VGLNLTAASAIILLDLWWNPAVENQAIDRVHRFGQNQTVRVWRLTVKNTVEQKLLVLQERKRALADAAVGAGSDAIASDGASPGGGPKKGLTMDDLTDFFRR